ncbi:DUF427 domain-containing protein [Streptomyces sp. t39]|uniref:DUF427 domain-containing protein n=1 Tax=Streptomyces sp. t39 TaxID=1828156 RepID=UPI0011CEBDF0|nr:DUF427 domain-containing protein [Streptomyces sp. t39]TXS46975.1 DUF427 domain-containing protein [Streptomyces sp. t39]
MVSDGAQGGPRRAPRPGARPKESVWTYPRPPAVAGDDRRVTVTVGAQTVAETHESLRVLETSHPPVFYLPRRDVRTDFLHPRPGRTHCEWKGTASYWDVVVGDVVVPRAAWSYERPLDPFAALRSHVAFYPSAVHCTVDGEVVVAQEGDFYGGWITSEIEGPFKGGAGTWGW